MHSFPLSRRISWRTALPAALLALAACHAAAPAGIHAGAARLTDAQVAGVALVASNIEMSYALLAADRTESLAVQAYADRMTTDHGSLAASLDELLGRLGIAARDDAIARTLRDASAAPRAHLATLAGPEFDAAYLAREIQGYRDLLGVIDTVLLPSVTRRDLREYVAALRPVVAAHLAHAEQLRATIASRAAAP